MHCETKADPQIPSCDGWDRYFCTSCAGVLSPLKINSDQNSLCFNNTISSLCEEMNVADFQNDHTMSCKRCKTMSSIVANYASLSLDKFDFVNQQQFFDFANGKINFNDILTAYPYIRAGLWSTQGQQYCAEYISVENCVKHDDSQVSSTFRCLQCSNEYYLLNNQCQSRGAMDTNCLEWDLYSTTCLKYLDYSSFSFVLSTFDLDVIKNPPSAYVEGSSQILGIEGCKTYVDAQTCKFCKSTFYLYDNLCLSITAKVPNCDLYLTDGICTECKEPFLLFQNKCLKKYAQNCNGYLSNTNCLRCPTQFPFFNSDGSCEKSSTITNCDTFDSLGSCLYCDLDFKFNKGLCQVNNQFVDHCERNMDGQLCNKCEEGYYPSGSLQSCDKNPKYDHHCRKYQTVTECIVCRYGYYFSRDNCVFCQTDPIKCLFCNPANPEQCSVCKPGFFMDNNSNCF